MDKAFNNGKLSLLRPITSVVVITLMAVLLFSVPQTYAMGTNEDFLGNLGQNYQQASKLSDLIQKVLNIFSQEPLAQNTTQSNIVNDALDATVQQNSCKKDFGFPFIDIQDSEYRDYIVTLYNKGIVIGSSNKFSPNSNLHFYCMIKILVDSYRSKIGYDLKTELGLSHKNYFTNAGADIDKISLKYLNTAYELGFLQGIEDFDISSKVYFQKNVSKYVIKQIFNNVVNQFPLLINTSTINQIESSQSIITRGEYTKYTVNLFDFKIDLKSDTCNNSWKTNFSDYMNHDYAEDIQVLDDLGIITSNAQNFHSNNYLRYYEFIIMLSRTILYKENQQLDIYVLDHISNISNIDRNSSYARYFEYAYHNGFLDYGFDPITGNPTIDPNRFIKIDEINDVFSRLVGREIQFKAKGADGIVTRGEFADMLADGFKLEEPTNSSLDTPNTSTQTSSLLNEIGGRLKSAKLLSKL